MQGVITWRQHFDLRHLVNLYEVTDKAARKLRSFTLLPRLKQRVYVFASRLYEVNWNFKGMNAQM